MGSAVAAALDQPAQGRTYELGGPGVYTFRQLMELMLRETHHRRTLLPVPFPIAKLIGQAGDLQVKLAPFIAPQITTDQVAMLQRDNVADPDLPGLESLGVAPTALEAVLPTYLWKYRKGGEFAKPLPSGD